MLVLSRRVGEAVVMAGGITVTVTRLERNRVSLGIEAPNKVQIIRREVLEGAHDGNDSKAAQHRTAVASSGS